MLHGGGYTARARPWPDDPSIAQLLTLDLQTPPPAAVLRAWMGELRRDAYTRVRTGAVSSLRTAPYDALGFTIIQRLTLLHLDLAARGARPARPAEPTPATKKGRVIDHGRFAELDHASFPVGWALDASSIGEAAAATPHQRVRFLTTTDGTLAGYAVTGRAGRAAFLQRLAVHPAAQGQGLGRALVVDSIGWAHRWRCRTMAVNTQDDNDTARRLYERAGFVARSNGLVVMERALEPAP